MASSKTIKNAEDVIKSVGIPPQPEVIIKIKAEMDCPSPNILRIADLVSQDVALAAATIKVASSPAVGLGTVKSITQALNLLGTKKFFVLVMASALKETLSHKDIDINWFETFWAHSLQVAKASTFIVKRLNKRLVDDAYLAGLFHDCGLPILLRRFDSYVDIVDHAMGPSSGSISVEDRLFYTNHAVVGYVLAKSWQLPQQIHDCILWHHCDELKFVKDDKLRLFINCVRLAEFILEEETAKAPCGGVEQPKAKTTKIKSAKDLQGSPIEKKSCLDQNQMCRITTELGLSEVIVEDIRDDVKELLQTD